MKYSRVLMLVFCLMHAISGICAEVLLEDRTKLWPIRTGSSYTISLGTAQKIKTAGIFIKGPRVCSVTLGAIEMKFRLTNGTWTPYLAVGSPGMKIRHDEQWASPGTTIQGEPVIDRVSIKFMDQNTLTTCPHSFGAGDDAAWVSILFPYVKDKKMTHLSMPGSFSTNGEITEGPSVHARVKDTIKINTLIGTEQLVIEGATNVQIGGSSIVGNTVTLKSTNSKNKVDIHYDRQTGELSWDLSQAPAGKYHGSLTAQVTAL